MLSHVAIKPQSDPCHTWLRHSYSNIPAGYCLVNNCYNYNNFGYYLYFLYLLFFFVLFIRILGIVFVIFGFLTLLGSMVYCIHVCKNSKNPGEIDPEDFYWTRYWQGHVGSAPEIHYKAEGKYQDDGGSDRSKYSVNYSERRSQRY